MNLQTVRLLTPEIIVIAAAFIGLSADVMFWRETPLNIRTARTGLIAILGCVFHRMGHYNRTASSGEHTRPRVSQSAPSPTASARSIGTKEDVLGEAPSTTREGACAPQTRATPPLGEDLGLVLTPFSQIVKVLILAISALAIVLSLDVKFTRHCGRIFRPAAAERGTG